MDIHQIGQSSQPSQFEQPRQLGPVLLCKAHTEPYERAFTSRGFAPYFVEVLNTNIVNREALQRVVEIGAGAGVGAGVEPSSRTETGSGTGSDQHELYAGVIVTSSRAAEAWMDAVKAVSTLPSYPQNEWDEMSFYVVGKATEKVLSSCPDLPLTPRKNKILGAESGNGEALAHFIISYYTNNNRNPKEETRSRPLLYLTGDKNRETLPQILGNAGFSVAKFQVYETGVVKDLEEKLESVIEKIKLGKDASVESPRFIWLTLFAPSTADYVLDALAKILEPEPEPEQSPKAEDPSQLSQPTHPTAVSIPGFKLVAIGPTTEKHLKSKGFPVSVCSPKPDAESLAEAILACLQTDQ